MVSKMAARMASVSPHRQETTIVNITPTTVAMMARRCQARIRGLPERCASLPRCWPMLSCGGSSPRGLTTGSRGGSSADSGGGVWLARCVVMVATSSCFAHPITSVGELCNGAFETDEELDAFLAFATESRHADLA
jgi:hypothetical protein